MTRNERLERLRLHRELEALRADGVRGGMRRQTRKGKPPPKSARHAVTAWQKERHRKLARTPKKGA